MGSVWIAHHYPSGTHVAVKVVHDRLAEDPKWTARFRREVTMAAQLTDPHIVRTIDHGEISDGRLFLVMELLDGQSLQERLRTEVPLSIHETKAMVTQVAHALTTAHAAGIVHRDVKPGNLFLVAGVPSQPFIKVLDFGVGKQLKAISTLTTTGKLVGTPYYMSPEQLMNSKAADARMDLWALSVVAFESLTRTKPFRAKTVTALSLLICQSRYMRPSALNPALGGAGDQWFARAFARRQDERFQTAAELAHSFAALPDHVP